ncbi:MAG: hypothetical protein ACM3L6_05740 [Deltaproteobacteria bacterium]
MFNLPDMSKLAQTAKEAEAARNKIEERKIQILQRIEQKLDQVLQEIKGR